MIDIKQQSLEYLKGDVLGLLEAMVRANNHFFNEYKLNLTDFSTIPGLAISLYGAKFYNKNSKNHIKMVKGPIEAFIRKAYKGGYSNVFVNGDERLIPQGYH